MNESQSLSKSTARLGKSSAGLRDIQLNSAQRNKIVVIRKIILISSMKKQIKKIMQKLIQNGLNTFTQDQGTILMEEAKKILDNDKQKDLAKDLSRLISNKENQAFIPETILKLIKYYVVSPVEKSYIVKIEKQLKDDEELDNEIKQIQSEINEEKNSKLAIYDLEKKGQVLGMSTKVINRKKEVQNYQNKLMRSNQKLNELCSNNNKLRDKISQLRKQKNAMQTIYNKLKSQLDKKNQNVQNTINFANQANKARYKSEKELKNLKQKAELKKDQFKDQCQKLNNQIQHDIRFKQFIKSKHIQKEQLDKLEQQIKINEKSIEDKKELNEKIDRQYKKSIAKQQQIRKAFDIIKKQIGIGDIGIENQGKQLLKIFSSLYEKNSIMTTFVEQLNHQVQDLQEKITSKKDEIQKMYLRGSADHCEKQKLNDDLKAKVQHQQRKKKILDEHYQKSCETIQLIKQHLVQIFQDINIDQDVIDKLKNCNVNEENLAEFLGELQKKGLQAISHYGKLVGEQLKAQKGSSWEVQKQIEDLNNIITLQNVNMMNSGAGKNSDSPSELIIKVKQDKAKDQELQRLLTSHDFKRIAIDAVEQFQKKQNVMKKPDRPKYAISTQANSHINNHSNFKAKKKSRQNQNKL